MFGKLFGSTIKSENKVISGTVERIGSYIARPDWASEQLTLLLTGDSEIREFVYAFRHADPIQTRKRVWSLTRPGDTVEVTYRVGKVFELVAIRNSSLDRAVLKHDSDQSPSFTSIFKS